MFSFVYYHWKCLFLFVVTLYCCPAVTRAECTSTCARALHPRPFLLPRRVFTTPGSLFRRSISPARILSVSHRSREEIARTTGPRRYLIELSIFLASPPPGLCYKLSRALNIPKSQQRNTLTIRPLCVRKLVVAPRREISRQIVCMPPQRTNHILLPIEVYIVFCTSSNIYRLQIYMTATFLRSCCDITIIKGSIRIFLNV